MKKQNYICITIIWCVVLIIFFSVLFYTDNKYQTPPPYGRDGRIMLTTEDLQRDTPLFLIDGWLISDSRVQGKATWIGEHSTLRRGDPLLQPHGAASYSIIISYSGAPHIVDVDFMALSTDYTICMDGKELANGAGGGRIACMLTPGDHTLTVKTVSQNGFYSGMYYPPALSLPDKIENVENIRSFAYGLAFLVPLTLAFFTLCIWNRREDPVTFWFGLLCCFFSLYVAWYFVELFHLPLWRYWFIPESIALYSLCFCVVRLTAFASGANSSKAFRRIGKLLVLWPACLLVLSILIPLLPGASLLHSLLKNVYFFIVFGSVLFFAIRCGKSCKEEYRYILAGDMVFGTGLLLNLFFSNRFEPIRFFWQFEWCGLLLIGLFAGMMVARNRRIITENMELTGNLEQLVEKRTQQLQLLLSERKAFFSDMAHDLKAPVFATKGFIDAIRKNDTGVDKELSYYLEQADLKQMEMSRRLQGLSSVNALDRIETPKKVMGVAAILSEIYESHHGEAEVASIHLQVTPPNPDCKINAQPEKLEILFENLVYNALKAIKADGSIDIVAVVEEEQVCISIADSGCGIPERELPHVFQRFFVGERNRGTGTGLGLYIVDSIVTELGGTVSVSSCLGKGTTFLIRLPIVH